MKKSSKDLGISDKISLIRQHFNLTAEALGEKAGVSGTAISNIEQGKSLNPGAELLASISSMLGVNLNWLLLGEGQMLKSAETPNFSIVSEPPSPAIVRGKPATYKGKSVATLRLDASAPPQEPPGTDLIQQVAKNTREIKLMQQTLETVVAELRQLTSSG